MGQKYEIYVDEAGDGGLDFDSRASRFFSVAAVIFFNSASEICNSCFQKVHKRAEGLKNFKQGSKNIPKFQKFSENAPWQNLWLCEEIIQTDISLVCVSVLKPAVKDSNFGAELKYKHLYPLKLVAERVSWAIRDHAKSKNIKPLDVSMWVSKRGKIQDEKEINAYFQKLKNRHKEKSSESDLNISQKSIQGRSSPVHGMEWKYFPQQIQLADFEAEKPIHLADIVASSFHAALEPSKEHQIFDQRFMLLLAKKLYVYQEKKVHGLKIFPNEKDIEKCSKELFDKHTYILESLELFSKIALSSRKVSSVR